MRHLLTLFHRVTVLCLRDVLHIPGGAKKLLAEVVEMTSLLYANTNAGQDKAFELLKKITASLLGFTSPKKGLPQPVKDAELASDMPERFAFVYQIASSMCLIGELCAQSLPKVKADTKSVPMGSVAIARLRYYFEYLQHVITLAPQVC